MTRILLAAALLILTATGQARAEEAAAAVPPATLENTKLLKIPAKQLFGAAKQPTAANPQAIGFYAKGCLAGAEELPVTSPYWQVMRLSRHRNFAHPNMIGLVERLAREAQKYDGWTGLLVGDMSQPRGGPMLSGHASHQVGLDADIWLTPMPDRVLSPKEREEIQARSVVKDRRTIDPAAWTEAHARLIKRAASYSEVVRIFVHPPIKAALCKWATGDRSWLAKVRPYYNHTYHFHIRIRCPAGSPTCRNQPTPAPADGTGCGNELAYWLGNRPWPKPAVPPKPVKPAPPLTLAALPAQCRAVVTAR